MTFIQLADAMELMLLSVLSPEVECEWGLSRSEEAAITSVSKVRVHVQLVPQIMCLSMNATLK